MSKIAILYIAVGKYTVFWEKFYKSFEEKFIKECDKEYFIFTDDTSFFDSCDKKLHIIEQENLGWPGNTLYRFRMFLTQKDKLKEFDYVFFMNANVECAENVGIEFLPVEEDLLVVQHPGFYNESKYRFPYDRNKKSTAYIPYGEGKVYVCGGINGGKSLPFLEMCEILNRRIDDDFDRGIIALWHDESQINKYILENENYKLLSPKYCFQESSENPFPPVLFVRDKAKYFDVVKVKNVNSKKVFLDSVKKGIIYRFFLIRDKIFKK